MIAATGFRPDLRCSASCGSTSTTASRRARALAPLIDPNLHSCGSVPPHGVDELAHPDAGFYMVGMKSYGRAPTFLLRTGYEQVRSIVGRARRRLGGGAAASSSCCPRPASAAVGRAAADARVGARRPRAAAPGRAMRRCCSRSRSRTSRRRELDPSCDRRAALRTRRRRSRAWAIVGALSVTETVSWGILYYAFAAFLAPMRAELGLSTAELTGAFSLGLLVAGVAGIAVGRYLDRHSPRLLMTAGSIAGVALVRGVVAGRRARRRSTRCGSRSGS